MTKKSLVVTIVIIVLGLFALVGFANAATKAVKIDRFKAIDKLGPNDYDLETLRIEDPENPFVSIYITHIIATGFQFSDPSNTSIACRLTSPIPVDKDGNQIINKETNHDIAHFSKSIGTKVMRISRSYDQGKNVLIYNVYTTKLFDGSLKHSLSVVPLGMPLIQ